MAAGQPIVGQLYRLAMCVTIERKLRKRDQRIRLTIRATFVDQ